jgi:hypothetical protein
MARQETHFLEKQQEREKLAMTRSNLRGNSGLHDASKLRAWLTVAPTAGASTIDKGRSKADIVQDLDLVLNLNFRPVALTNIGLYGDKIHVIRRYRR